MVENATFDFENIGSDDCASGIGNDIDVCAGGGCVSFERAHQAVDAAPFIYRRQISHFGVDRVLDLAADDVDGASGQIHHDDHGHEAEDQRIGDGKPDCGDGENGAKPLHALTSR